MYKPLLLGLTLLSQMAWAESHIERIKRTKTVTVGYMSDDFPFSYLNKNGDYRGFGVDITNKVVDIMREKLNTPDLKIEVKPITFQNRFEVMQSGELDFSCSAHSNLTSRRQWVDFSYNFFVARGRLMVPQNSEIDSFKDLEGKNIGVLKDSSAGDSISKKRLQYKYEIPVTADTTEELFNLLRNGQVSAIAEDDILLTGFIAQKNEMDKFKFVGPAITLDTYACIVPKGDKEMKDTLDQALFDILTTGDIEPIYNRWFLENIPDYGVNLNFELNNSIRSLYSKPTDHQFGD